MKSFHCASSPAIALLLRGRQLKTDILVLVLPDSNCLVNPPVHEASRYKICGDNDIFRCLRSLLGSIIQHEIIFNKMRNFDFEVDEIQFRPSILNILAMLSDIRSNEDRKFSET